ncbi:hypothetical protein [Mesorhizobium sp. YM1C-6-2]|uniref:hypothetical protein n=1 Tax=Mesorhizobium sp. YM1C-6-2 TaxID=1827501 RepID=UPI000EF223CA|nr:hypothetical protein [Mesorhizobium sp. YM1C-6-2]RLP25787.1 hypothetical protein D8676_08660 [Mesorhizobium sp. YM1C-6-2]
MRAKLKMYMTGDGPKAGTLLKPHGGRNPDVFHGPRGPNPRMYNAAIALLRRPQGVTGDELAAQQEALGGSPTSAAYEWHLKDLVHLEDVQIVKVERASSTEYHLVLE